MQKVTFKLCDCGAPHAHGHFYHEEYGQCETPIVSKNQARTALEAIVGDEFATREEADAILASEAVSALSEDIPEELLALERAARMPSTEEFIAALGLSAENIIVLDGSKESLAEALEKIDAAFAGTDKAPEEKETK